MKNKNSDEKVTSINPLNQSQWPQCMQSTVQCTNLLALYSKRVQCWTEVSWLQILQLTEIQLSYPFNIFTRSPCIYIWKPPGSIWSHRALSEWKINGHKHSLWENQHKRLVLLLPVVRWASCRPPLTYEEWVIGVSLLSTAMSFLCEFQFFSKYLPSQMQWEMQTQIYFSWI